MKESARIKWLNKMAFDVELNGHHFTIDANPRFGGENQGPKPKGLLLTSLAGCTGMDVVSILKKMKIEDYQLEINIEGELTEEHPRIYHTINLNFVFKGDQLPEDKIKKAVELSETRYCGVTEMLRRSSKIKTKIFLNGENIE
ncbi:MAG: OsmC family protein [Candidatus Cloacimonetes bacterium]|nr:OsmC family protein [Candidatus Cloacimonadota bacterium]